MALLISINGARFLVDILSTQARYARHAWRFPERLSF
jgi:hypothetical protein